MNKKHIIIIGLIILILILTCCIATTLTQTVTYERIELAPNATSIEIPTNNVTYVGEVNETGAKLWKFKQGTLMSFNSAEAVDARGLYGLAGAMGFKELKDMVINHFEKKETIDGFTVYTLDGETLDIQGRDKVYCIMIGNETTHDNIVITTDNKDITVHMAKSIKYKSGNGTVNATVSNATSISSGQSVSTSSNTPTKNTSTEGEYGGFTREEAIYREGLADGHRQAEEALSKNNGIDAYTVDSSSSSSSDSGSDSGSNVETTTAPSQGADAGHDESANVEYSSSSDTP